MVEQAFVATEYGISSLPGVTGPLPRARALWYSAGSVGAGAFYAFNNFVLPQLLSAAGAGDLLTGLLSSTRSIEGALVQPVVGALSDRTRSRLGRRRPYLLVGASVSAVLFLVAATRSDLAGLAIAIVLFSLAFNVAADPYVALLADITRPGERAGLQGLSTAVQLASQVAFLVVVARAGDAAIPGWTYAAVAVLLVGSFGLTVAGVREPAPPAATRAVPGIAAGLRALRAERQAFHYLAAVFVFMLGFSAVLPYLTLFITVDIGASRSVALGLAAAALLVTALAALGSGRLADRIGPKPVLVLGWLLIAGAALGGLLVQRLPETVAIVVLAGLGNGAATAAGWPLLVSLIPAERTGTFAGLKASAESIAIPASVLIAAVAFLPRFSYRGVFALLAVAIGVALLLLVRTVHPPSAADARLSLRRDAGPG
jgi:Na+/melibiose symporter-like transporter